MGKKNIGFDGGVPYALDVRRLSEAFNGDDLTEGRMISHQEIEAVLGESKGTRRYYSVVNSWIRKQRHEHARVLTWQPGVGLTVLTPSGVLGHAELRTRHKARQLGGAVKLFRWVDRARLDEAEKPRLDFQIQYSARMAAAVAAEASKMEFASMPASITSLPRRMAL